MFRLTRMEVTLGCLVASMTLGAAMLDWFQPNQPAAPWRTTELMARHIQAAIHPAGRPTPQSSSWNAIRFEPHPAGKREGLDQFDIVIDREGNYVLTGNLKRESNSDQSKGVIRIGVLVPPTSNETNSAQSLTAAELTNVLREQCGISEQNVEKHGNLVFHPVPPAAFSETAHSLPFQTNTLGR